MQLNSQCLDREPTLAHMFTDEERFCVAVAALAHDLGHSGTNNHF
jgi:HD superfamily phosphohydrolase